METLGAPLYPLPQLPAPGPFPDGGRSWVGEGHRASISVVIEVVTSLSLVPSQSSFLFHPPFFLALSPSPGEK